MADGARNFGAEMEALGHFGVPTLDGFLGRGGVKSRVALDRGQPSGVLAQEVGGLGTLWVEIAYPTFE